jgi:hypothetical protein
MILAFPSVGAMAPAIASVGTGPVDAPVEVSFPSSPPISIDDTETVGRHHCELNLTVGFSGRPGSWETEAPLLDANFGLTDDIHVNAEIPYVFGVEDGAAKHGLGNAAVAVKLRVIHRERIQFAFHPAVALPPLPGGVSYEAHAGVSLTLPVVVDVAVGDRGAGVGFQLSRTFTGVARADDWGAAIGIASPVGACGALLFDYVQHAGPDRALGEGWLEVGYVRGNLFGSEHLTLLSSLGRSTYGNTSGLLGVQISR